MTILPKRLPRKFNRQTSATTRAYLKRKRSLVRTYKYAAWKRIFRRATRVWIFIKENSIRFTLIFTGVMASAVLIIILFSGLFSVHSIALSGTNSRLDTEEIQQQLHPLFGRHLLLIAKSDILQLIQPYHTDVTDVQITKEYPNTLRIQFTLTPLVAQLKRESETVAPKNATTNTGSTNTQFITEDGLFVQLEFPSEADLQLKELYIAESGLEFKKNDVVLPVQILKDIETIEPILKDQFGLDVTKRIVFIHAQEYHLYIGNRALWFDTKSPALEQIARYKKFLETHIQYPMTEYIDLRLQDRIIWK